MVVTLLGMVMEVRPEQPKNALLPMLVTLLGIMVFLHPNMSELFDVLMIALQLLRESYSVLPGSTMMEVRPEQAPNTLLPMLVTLLGMVMEVRPEQPENASSPMLVTSSPNMISSIDVNLLNELSIFLQSNVTDVRPEQPENALSPILVTLLGMVTEVRPEQP